MNHQLMIEGIFVPHVVPLDERGRIDEDELRRYLEWLIQQGVHGLYPNGSTGEFTRFTAQERQRIVKIACEAASGRVPVLAGAAEANVAETIRACETYADYGARAVAIVSPFYYRIGQESVYAYFSEIAAQSPIDVTLYNIPMFATPIEVSTIRRLAEHERIVGIKDSSGDVAFMLRMMGAIQPQRPEFIYLVGWEPALLPLLMMGCNGATHATAGVAPGLTKRLFELARAGDLENARPLQLQLIALFDAMLAAGDFPTGFRIGAELLGFQTLRSRQTGVRVAPSARDSISRELRKALDSVISSVGGSSSK